jgi:murein DD-endopeptidase MepM/ murein hydrolase activator NlpD
MRPGDEITGSVPAPAPASAPKPRPLSEDLPRERRTEAAPSSVSVFDRQIAELSEKLLRAEVTQTRALDGVERGYGGRVTRMRTALTELGLPLPQDSSLTRFSNAMGGPFLPFFRTDDPFERQMSRIRLAAREFETLAQTFEAVPVRRPTQAALEVTSGYGMRLDPFLKQLAMHTGVDFRAEPGDPVRATAGGKVTQAGWQGGYGIMVEIDHGNGLATRYAHLSAADVAEGTTIPVGRIIGRTGSTGRSTGPHLHYEIRANGDAIDPMRFLRAGARLSGGF